MRDVLPVGDFFNDTQPIVISDTQPAVLSSPDVAPVQQFFETAKPETPEFGFKRGAGLFGRGAIQGIASPVTFPVDLLGAGIEALTGKQILEPLAPIVSETLTNIGFPEPATAAERVGGDIVEGATGGAGLGKLGQRLITGAAGATGAGASGTARELGAGVGTQIAVGLAGGLTGAAGARNVASRIGQASDDILTDISRSGVDEVSSFLNVREDIVKNATNLTKQKNRLFKVAGEKGADAFVAPDKTAQLATKITDLQKNIFDPNGRSALDLVSTRLGELSKLGKQNVNEFQTMRRGLTKLSNSSDGGIRQAAGEAKGLLDDFLLEPGVVSGKKESVKLWNKAISANRKFAQKFEEPAEIAKAIAEETNEVVEQAFIGSGGAALNKKLANVYEDALKAVNPKQRKLTGFRLKQSIVNRMIKNAAQSVDDPEGISASRLANQIRNFRRDNQSMWNKFTPKEKSALNGLEKSMRKELKGGVVNRVFTGVEKFIKGGLGQNIELPRTLKPKTVIGIDDLLELTTARASAPTGKAITLGIGQAVNEQGE